jgi:hypothetical protein
LNDLVEKQLLIEKTIEKELLHDEYKRDRIYANRYEIRECLFYKEGVPLKEKTLDLYLKEIQRNPSHSIPYRKIQKEIKDLNLFFLNSSFGRELSLETISLVPTLPHSAISV